MPACQRIAALVVAAFCIAQPAAAQSFPTKEIRLVVPYAAGGSTDQLARAIQRSMAQTLGQPVIVENRPGAGGTLGVNYVVRARPDGYTLVFGNTGPNAIVGLMRQIPYDPQKDLRPISTVAFTPMILAVPSDSPARSVAGFIAYAKQAPRGSLNIGSVGNGSLSHLTAEAFGEAASIQLQHIPYNGGAPMMTAFEGGQLHAAFVTGLDGATLVASGKVRYLAVATPKPTDVVPGLPAIAERLPDFKSSAWFGVLAPKGTPNDVIDTLNAAVVKAVAEPELRRFFAARNVEARSSTPAQLGRLIADEMAQWQPVIRKADIKMD